MKKLPDLYTNSFNNKIDNSLKYIIVNNEKIPEKKKDYYSIRNKIDNLFKSNTYIYKIKVNIILNNKEITKILIGKNKNNLITIDNELININDILDIKEIK